MFDRCGGWRDMLTRRAEGGLTLSERALLDDHLSRCEPCRRAEAADAVLAGIFAGPVEADLEVDRSGFDDRVLQMLATPEARPLDRIWRWFKSVRPPVSFDFCMQLAGGALTAAAITAFCVVSGLHPNATLHASSASETASIKALQGNEPPVPMESLIQSSSPRAAMLWVQPGAVRRRAFSPGRRFAPEGAPSAVPSRPRFRRRTDAPHSRSEQLRSYSVI